MRVFTVEFITIFLGVLLFTENSESVPTTTAPCSNSTGCFNFFCPSNITKLNETSKDHVKVTQCGKHYIFINTKLTVKEYPKFCCVYGMRGVNVETQKDLDCLDKAFKGLNLQKARQYLVRTTDMLCRGTYRWCDANILVSNDLWTPKETPAAQKFKTGNNCAAAFLQPISSKIASGLITHSCFEKQFSVCESFKEKEVITSKEVQKEVLTNTTPANQVINTSQEVSSMKENFKIAVASPAPPSNKSSDNINSTVPQNSTITTDTQVSNSSCINTGCSRIICVKKPYNESIKLRYKATACGRQYMFILDKHLYSEWPERCCEHFMKGIQLESDKDVACLEQAYKTRGLRQTQPFYVHTTDVLCPGTYRWCESNSLVTSKLWLPGQSPSEQPNKGDKNCAAVQFQPAGTNRSGLVPVSCSSKQFVACEDVRQNTIAQTSTTSTTTTTTANKIMDIMNEAPSHY